MKDPRLLFAMITLILLVGYISFNEFRLVNTKDVKPEPQIFQEIPEDPIVPNKNVSIPLPNNLNFAGEVVPLGIPDVKERLDRELHINSYWHNNSIFLIKRANRWFPEIEKILAKNNIPNDFKYMPVIESALINDISPKEAVGFWQFMKGTAKEFGLIVNREVDERYNPLKATEAACKYLRKAYEKFGSWTLAAASYDAGMRRIERSLEQQKVDSYYDLLLNGETYRYVFRILAVKELLSDPEKYGFHISKEHLYQWEPQREMEITETISNLVDFAHNQGINLKILKRHNPWLRSNKLTVRKGKKFIISVPDN